MVKRNSINYRDIKRKTEINFYRISKIIYQYLCFSEFSQIIDSSSVSNILKKFFFLLFSLLCRLLHFGY
jgi:hypothetical protein